MTEENKKFMKQILIVLFGMFLLLSATIILIEEYDEYVKSKNEIPILEEKDIFNEKDYENFCMQYHDPDYYYVFDRLENNNVKCKPTNERKIKGNPPI